MAFDFSAMYAIFQSFWVRKLIGKLGVSYNRRLRVRGSPYPQNTRSVYTSRTPTSSCFQRRRQQGIPKPVGLIFPRLFGCRQDFPLFLQTDAARQHCGSRSAFRFPWTAHFLAHKKTFGNTKILVDSIYFKCYL